MATIGTYKGVSINAGTDAEVAAQMDAINAQGSTVTKPNAAGGGKSDSGGDPFLDTLQEKLLKQSDLVQSTSSEIDKKISKAIGGVRKAQEASAGRIESQFGREIGYALDEGELERLGVNEASTGFARNTALLRLIDERTDKDIKDLEQRKQELLLQGESDAASQISTLQLQSLQFKQEAQQNMFQNLLSIGSFGIQRRSEERLTRAQSFQEEQALSEIALEFGIEVRAGDTIETITARAAPYASEEQQLRLQEMRTRIARDNAEISQIKADAAAGNINSTNIDAIAQAYLTPGIGTAILGGVKDPNMQAAVINRATELRKDQFRASAQNDKANGLTKKQSITAITTNTGLDEFQRAEALKAVEEVYGEATTAETKVGFDLQRFITGKPTDTRGQRVAEIGREIERLSKINTYAARQQIEELKRERASI